jgi:hypothetical protein
MARLPISGSTSCTPRQSKAELGNVLAQLCPDRKFHESDIRKVYGRLAQIIGQWSAEDNRLDVAPLAKTFTAMGKELKEVAKILSGHEEGLHDIHDTEIVSQLAMILALDPEVGSRQQANKLLASFRSDAAKVAHACLVVAGVLKRTVGKSGRPQMDWYDEFTELLLTIAKSACINPQLWKDRDEGDWRGWLFEASQRLQVFFPPEMHPPSREAAGKRLERSQEHLESKHRQNPSAV